MRWMIVFILLCAIFARQTQTVEAAAHVRVSQHYISDTGLVFYWPSERMLRAQWCIWVMEGGHVRVNSVWTDQDNQVYTKIDVMVQDFAPGEMRCEYADDFLVPLQPGRVWNRVLVDVNGPTYGGSSLAYIDVTAT